MTARIHATGTPKRWESSAIWAAEGSAGAGRSTGALCASVATGVAAAERIPERRRRATVRPVRDCPTVACWRCRLSDLDIAQFLSARLEGRLQCSDQSVRSEEHTSELQSLMRISYAVFCLNKKKKSTTRTND